MNNPQTSRASFLSDASIGPILGCLLALAEYLAHFIRGAPLLLPSLLPGVLILYMLVWGLAGVITALLLSLLRRTGFPPAAECRTQLALLGASAIALTSCAVVVSHFLVDLERPFLYLIWGGALLAMIPLFLFLRNRLPQSWHPPLPAFFLLPALIAAGCLPLQMIPEARGGDDSPRPGTFAKGPHILLIVFDTLRFDHTGAYGYTRDTTPVLDRFAREGVLFERAYAPSSWTLPSTASLLTGRYPSSHGVEKSTSALSDELETLPAILRGRGYRTGLFSGNPFVEPNFGFRKGYERIHATTRPMYLRLFYLPIYLKTTFGRTFLIPGGSDSWVTRYESIWRPGLKKEWIEGGELTGELFRWIDEEEDRPLFAHVQIMEPHEPYVGRGRFGREGISRATMLGTAPLHPFDTIPDPTPDKLEIAVGRYDDNVWSADLVLESIVAGMEERGLLEDTWIVLTSDHGEEFHEHGGCGHGNSLYEELIRVPLIFHGKGIMPRRVQSLARLIDVAPTICALAGAPPPGGAAGISLLPILLGDSDETGLSEVYAEVNRARGRGASMLILSDGSKVIRSRGEGEEIFHLFNLADDPLERVNLYGRDRERSAAAVEKLLEAELNAAEGKKEGVESTLDPVTEKRLRALGYIQ